MLDATVKAATAVGLKVVLAAYPYPPREIEAGVAKPAAFAAWLGALATRYPEVTQYVVGNEPNQPAFFRPQFVKRQAGVGGPLRAVPGARLRRAQGRQPGDRRRRRGALAARQRQARRQEQHLDLASPLPRGARCVVPEEQADAPADGRFQLPPLPEQRHRPAHRRLPVAGRRVRQPRPHPPGPVGRVRRHAAADDARRAAALPQRGRLAGRHRRRSRATSATRTSRSPTRSPRARSTATSSGRPRASPTSPRSTSSGSSTTRSAPASRRRSIAPTGRRVRRRPRSRRRSPRARAAARAAVEAGARCRGGGEADRDGGRRRLARPPRGGRGRLRRRLCARRAGRRRSDCGACSWRRGVGGRSARRRRSRRRRPSTSSCRVWPAARSWARVSSPRRTPAVARSCGASSASARRLLTTRSRSRHASVRRALDTEHMFCHRAEHMFASRHILRMLVVAVTVLVLWALFANDSGASGPAERYTVQQGDTLWSIAVERFRRRSPRGRLGARAAQPALAPPRSSPARCSSARRGSSGLGRAARLLARCPGRRAPGHRPR